MIKQPTTLTSISPRPELEHIRPVKHGGFRSTLEGQQILDFSANVNPFGPSPRVIEAIQNVPINQHPDPRATPLRQALAAQQGVEPHNVIVGNGSADLIYQLTIAYLRPNDRVVVVGPTFGEYAMAAAIMGAEVITTTSWNYQDDQRQFTFALDELVRLLEETQPRMLVLCNPNNPTSTYLPQEDVERIIQAAPNTLVMLDEAYIGFVEENRWRSNELLGCGNLFILRTMTKDYALTGLRVGYGLGAPDMITALEKVQPPWTVNALAQQGGLAALADQPFLHQSIESFNHSKHQLIDDLRHMGYDPIPPATLFFMVPVASAEMCAKCLLEQGMLVRDCTSFGLPTFIRIGPRTPEDNGRLLHAIATCKGACHTRARTVNGNS
jgi:histidinol-phosphate aminotransferase